VDECNPVHVESLNKTVILAGCDQLCNNTPGNYTCSCNKGYRLLSDGKQCEDINECVTNNGNCSHQCINTVGFYLCRCKRGFNLDSNGHSCTEIKAPSDIPTTDPSASRILELKLFYKGELDSLDTKDKQQILQLVEEEVTRVLSTGLPKKKKSEISITENGVQVILYVSAAGVDEPRLHEVLSNGIEIEYHGRKMRFIGSVTTHYPIPTSAPAKDSGKLMGKEGTKQLPWKLPAIIGGPILVGLVIAIAGGVLLCKRRKIRKQISVSKTSQCQFDNPVYASFAELPKEEEKRDDSFVDGSRSHTRSDGSETHVINWSEVEMQPVQPVKGSPGNTDRAGVHF